jgi:fibro-slime domain-containing protein
MRLLATGCVLALGWASFFLLSAAGCSSSSAARSRSDNAFDTVDPGVSGAGGTGMTEMVPGQAGGLLVVVPDDAGADLVDAAGGVFVPGPLPADFHATEQGGYKLGDPLASGASLDAGAIADAGAGNCGNTSTLVGVVRDFHNSHPDFTQYCCGDMRGAIASTLGDDQKPVYALPGPAHATNNGPQLSTGPMTFDQWYRTIDGVNEAFLVYLFFVPANGVFTFQSTAYFPLDGKGFGNEYLDHNYSFTTELHTTFRYKGGETFRFTGDDDLWVFINKKLAIDLGGVHNPEDQTVVLDDSAAQLGIAKGTIYSLDLFQAERHPTGSNFRVDTNLEFVSCGVIVPDEIVK